MKNPRTTYYQENFILEHPKNARIKYVEEGHFYLHSESGFTKHDSTRWSGITTLIKKYEPFKDFTKIAAGTARKLTKETGVLHTKEMVLKMWRGQTNRGTEIHKIVEKWVETQQIPPEHAWYIHEVQVSFDVLDLIPIAAEFVIYDESIKTASMVDILCVRKGTGKLVVVDTKTMKDDNIFRLYNETFMDPVYGLETSKYNKFCLQVNFYVKWLREMYNADVDDEHYVLHLNDTESKILVVTDLSKEVSDVTEHYKKFHL